MVDAVREGSVVGVLLDVYVAAENAHKLTQLELQEITEHVVQHGKFYF